MSDKLHFVCPHCHTTNRIAADQLGSAPDCGSPMEGPEGAA